MFNRYTTRLFSSAAVILGLTTGALTRFLHDDPAVWTQVNAVRVELGMSQLRWHR